MSGLDGWDGKSLKTHVEDARHLAGGAMSLAQAVCDEVEMFKADLVVVPVSEAKAKVMRRRMWLASLSRKAVTAWATSWTAVMAR